MSARGERTLFATLAALTFVYIVLRAVLVPLTHDEAATFQTYVLTGRYLPYIAHWDAGNHLLITAVGRGCYLVLGSSPLSLRAFSVLCFGLYAFYTWRLTRPLSSEIIRQATATSLLLAPFLLDFFSLFRGYGPALAFLLMALFHGLRYARSGARADLLMLLVSMLLVNLASLTLLIVWSAGLGMVLLRIARQHRSDIAQWLAWLILGALPLALAARYSVELAARGLLYYGTPEGLLHGTLPSLSKWVLGTGSSLLPGLIWITPLILALIAWRYTSSNMPLRLLLLVVGAELAGRVLLGAGFHVLYPMDRTAMHLVPLSMLLAAQALDAISATYANARWAALLMLWMPLRTVAGINLDHTRFWPEQAIPDQVFDAVMARQCTIERPLLVGGYRQNPRAWAYGSMRRGGTLNFIDDTGFPQPTCDLMILDPTFFRAPSGFTEVFRATHGRLVLYERDTGLALAIRSDSTRSIEVGTREFVELWAPSINEVHGSEWFVEFDGELFADKVPLELRVVVEVKDTLGDLIHYDVVDLEDLGADWTTRTVHVLRRLPRFSSAPGRIACYLWNPRHQRFGATRTRTRIHQVLPN